MRPAIVALIALLVMVAAACGDDDAATTSSSTTAPSGGDDVPAALVGREWVLAETVTIAGPEPVPNGLDATIEFAADGTVEIHTGCNQGTGRATFDGDRLALDVAVTETGCADAEYMNLEGAELIVLGTEMTWLVADDLLVLTPTTISDSGLRYRAADT